MKAPQPETIAAIATAVGPAGVGVVRLSGPGAFTVADRLLHSRSRTSTAEHPGHTLHRAVVREPDNGDEIDDALIAVFHAPRSFTGEDVVEIQAHGGSITLGRILNACLAAGARAARPGEFSERAFLHGKMDLAQAEAVADLVAARTVAAQRVARRQVAGRLSEAVGEASAALQEALARIEASIDFPEEVGEADPEALDHFLGDAERVLQSLLETAGFGRRLHEGLTIVLAGRPNVGKSSLLNALAGAERAIVTSIAGTTRDVVEEALQFGGIPVRALDTAGIRETTDPVEQIGVERARAAVAAADVVIAVLDCSTGVVGEDRSLLRELAGRPTVVVLNKSDLCNTDELLQELEKDAPPFPVLPVSAVTGDGLDGLRDALVDVAVGGAADANDVLVTSARHEEALRAAAVAIGAARETLAAGMPVELIAVDAHGALQALGTITGETAREEIIAGIFSRFCIGK